MLIITQVRLKQIKANSKEVKIILTLNLISKIMFCDKIKVKMLI